MNVTGAADKDRVAAIVLAGGEGTRLRALTRRIAGCDIPKQFCPLMGPRTLLEQTRCRASLLVDPDRIMTVLTRTHERFYSSLLAKVDPQTLVIQPEGRGTAPAILYALLRVAAVDPTASVVILPSDHYIDDDRRFMNHINLAFRMTKIRPELTVLVGIAPDSPEPAYGWIEPGEPIDCGTPLFGVRHFWEKPSRDVATNLMSKGCLWNSFVIIGRVSTLLGLVMVSLPGLHNSFSAIRSTLGTHREESSVASVYANLRDVNFSDEVLQSHPLNLAVLPMEDVKWSDLGEPQRVLQTLVQVGLSPKWAAA